MSMSDKKFQKTIKLALLVVLVIALCFAIIFFFQYRAALKDPRNNVAYQNSDTELGINPRVADELENYRCLAFYGVDEDGVSGVILVAAIDWDTHHCKLFKVKANTYMELSPKRSFEIKGKERSKFACSYAYAKGGLVTSMKMLNRHLDLPIREGIGVDLNAVAEIVNDLGGIKIKISQSMCDEINNRFYHPGQIKVKNGMAKLNGQQTLEYISTWNNTHETSEVDTASAFDVFVAIFNRIKEKDENKLLKMLDFAFKGCDSNMNIKDLVVFAKEIDTYDVEQTTSWPYNSKEKLVGGYSVAVPNTLASNVSKLHEEIFSQKNYKVTKTCARLSAHNK